MSKRKVPLGWDGKPCPPRVVKSPITGEDETLHETRDAWRQSSSEYKARVYRAIIEDKAVAGVDGQPVRMVPTMRAKLLDKITGAAAAHEDRQRQVASRPRNPTRKYIEKAIKGAVRPADQYERYKALAGDEAVRYERFKEVRLEILKLSK